MIFENVNKFLEKRNQIGRICGIDWGERKIGFAINDFKNIISSPFGIFQNDEKIFDKISEIVRENQIKIAIIGFPLDESGNWSENCYKVKEFSEKILEKSNIDIIFYDERMTTRAFATLSLTLGNFGKQSLISSKRNTSKKISQMKSEKKQKYAKYDEDWKKNSINNIDKKIKVNLNTFDYQNDDAGSACQILSDATSVIMSLKCD